MEKIDKAISILKTLGGYLSVNKETDIASLCKFDGKHGEITRLYGELEKCLWDIRRTRYAKKF